MEDMVEHWSDLLKTNFRLQDELKERMRELQTREEEVTAMLKELSEIEVSIKVKLKRAKLMAWHTQEVRIGNGGSL